MLTPPTEPSFPSKHPPPLQGGGRLRLDMAHTLWGSDPVDAAKLALENNPRINEFHLSLRGLVNEYSPKLIDLPAHVTSATFDFSEAHPTDVSVFFSGSALPGVEVLSLILPLHANDLLVELGAGLRNALRGAPRLRRLKLRATGYRSLATFLAHFLRQKAPPGCVVELSFELLVHTSASAALKKLGLDPVAVGDVAFPPKWAMSMSRKGEPVPYWAA